MHKLIIPVLLVLVMVAAWVMISTQSQRIEILQADNNKLQSELATLTAQYALTQEAYQALFATQSQISAKADNTKRIIRAAPAQDDAPIAPVLKQALEALDD